MNEETLKKYLIQIADQLTPESTLEDVYDQLALLADIDESEEQEKKGEIFTQQQVRDKSKEWLR
ncbi:MULTISPECIES: hypothetical protein [Cytophagales]|uniref:Addiction module component n=3 Tax=Cytophagales TaxID=768507 RepID=A0A848J5X1_9BACT|nr:MULTISPECIES: hypothetical protein [Cytophagales]MCX2745640.1 hypothetical protein [Mangrovivirga halotolerans]NMM50855.1 hypothetical protein [Marinigracilibium pacificum]QCK15625.1 hypothetical protein DCC35_13165 [Mangrovivirga cuniculi]